MNLVKSAQGLWVPEAPKSASEIAAAIAAEKARLAAEAAARATAAAAAFKGKNDRMLAKRKELMGKFQ